MDYEGYLRSLNVHELRGLAIGYNKHAKISNVRKKGKEELVQHLLMHTKMDENGLIQPKFERGMPSIIGGVIRPPKTRKPKTGMDEEVKQLIKQSKEKEKMEKKTDAAIKRALKTLGTKVRTADVKKLVKQSKEKEKMEKKTDEKIKKALKKIEGKVRSADVKKLVKQSKEKDKMEKKTDTEIKKLFKTMTKRKATPAQLEALKKGRETRARNKKAREAGETI